MNLSKLLYMHALQVAAYPLFYRGGNPPKYGELDIARADQPMAGDKLQLTTWNIGYGALGARANFAADGGNDLRALSRAEIEAAVKAIAEEVKKFGSDILLLQELANPNWLTRQVPVLGQIDDALKSYASSFWEGLRLPYVPKWLNLSHGMGVFSQKLITDMQAYRLQTESGSIFAGIKKHYAKIVSRLPIDGSDREWVVINVHLSAFDKGAKVRQEQIGEVFDMANIEYQRGNYVVIGGDWNMRLVAKEFPHETRGTNNFIAPDFPVEKLPKGWQIVADDSVPTVRALHRPYEFGVNNTSIIDGFAFSPNVSLVDIAAKDMAFKHTDHHPVTGVFQAA